jgi:hypothetical protein
VIHLVHRTDSEQWISRRADVGFDNGQGRVGGEVVEVPAAAGQQIVDDDDPVAAREQRVDQVAPDHPRAAGDECSHVGVLSDPHGRHPYRNGVRKRTAP